MCDGGYIELNLTTPKARKNYRCEWCNGKIVIGEKHVNRVYLNEGDFVTGRMHDECFTAMEKSPHDDICDGWMQGEFKRGQKADKSND